MADAGPLRGEAESYILGALRVLGEWSKVALQVNLINRGLSIDAVPPIPLRFAAPKSYEPITRVSSTLANAVLHLRLMREKGRLSALLGDS